MLEAEVRCVVAKPLAQQERSPLAALLKLIHALAGEDSLSPWPGELVLHSPVVEGRVLGDDPHTLERAQ